MATEQVLYAQVFLIRRKESENQTENKNTKKYNFQGQSARTRRWLNIDYECRKEDSMTREPGFYRKLYKTKFRGDDTKSFSNIWCTNW